MTVSGCADPWPSPPWHTGPLASHINWFAERLAEQGYAPFTAQEKLRLVMHLSQWLGCVPPSTQGILTGLCDSCCQP